MSKKTSNNKSSKKGSPTLGRSSTGLGSLEKAYGPAKGGLVTVSYSIPGPMSGFSVLTP